MNEVNMFLISLSINTYGSKIGESTGQAFSVWPMQQVGSNGFKSEIFALMNAIKQIKFLEDEPTEPTWLVMRIL